MEQILNSFGDIVVNASDALRLHEECDLLSLRIDKAPSVQSSEPERWSVTAFRSSRSLGVKLRAQYGSGTGCCNVQDFCCQGPQLGAIQILHVVLIAIPASKGR